MLTRAFDAGYKAGTLAMANHTGPTWPVEPSAPWKRLAARNAFAHGFKHAVMAIRAERAG